MDIAIAKFRETIKAWIKPYLPEKRPLLANQRCAISFSNKQVFILHLKYTQELVELKLTETFQYEDLDNLQILLSSAVLKYHLQMVPVYWLLSPVDYQLFLIDSLPVAKEEFNSALNWRIRSLTTTPIDELLIDYFSLPAKKSSSNIPMIAAVTAKIHDLQPKMDVIKKSGLQLRMINIPELAMRNLTAVLEQDDKSTAFIYFFSDTVILNITRHNVLYFTRHLNVNFFAPKPEEDVYSALSLDILRYFDFFRSQWRFPSPTRIFVASNHTDPRPIAENLSKALLLTVEVFSGKFLSLDIKKNTAIEKDYLLTLGCALKRKTENATTGD